MVNVEGGEGRHHQHSHGTEKQKFPLVTTFRSPNMYFLDNYQYLKKKKKIEARWRTPRQTV